MHGMTPDRYAADLDSLRADLGDDDEMVRDLCRMFLKDTPALMLEIGRALEAGELQTVQRTAHRLKGSVGVFHAPEVFSVAHQMETAGARADQAAARAVLEELERAVDAMVVQLGVAADATCPA